MNMNLMFELHVLWRPSLFIVIYILVFTKMQHIVVALPIIERNAINIVAKDKFNTGIFWSRQIGVLNGTGALIRANMVTLILA